MTHRIATLPQQPPSAVEIAKATAIGAVLPLACRVVGTSNQTGLTTSQASTVLLTNAPAGNYLATVYAEASSSTGGTLTVTLTWHDAQSAQSVTTISGLALTANGAPGTSQQVIYHNGSGSIAFGTTVGGVSLTYDIHITLIRLN